MHREWTIRTYPLRLDRYNAAAFFAFALYSVVWSDISITRFVNLQATILDLGANMQIAWNVLQNPGSYFSVLPQGHGSLLPWILVFLPGTYWFALIFQSVWIGLGSLPLFWISKRRLGNRVALVVSCLYLTYFPLAGPNWFDFHVETLFPTIFLFGYYFRTRGDSKLSCLVMALAASVRFPYTIFPFIFSAMELYLARPKYGEDRGETLKRTVPYFILYIYCIALFGYFFYFIYGGSLSTFLSTTYINSQAVAATVGTASAVHLQLTTLSPIQETSLNLVRTFLLYFAPLLFVPFISLRWWPFYLPYLSLLLLSGYYGLYYPYVFTFQYPAMMAAFVFLGLTDALAYIRFGRKEPANDRPFISWKELPHMLIKLARIQAAKVPTLRQGKAGRVLDLVQTQALQGNAARARGRSGFRFKRGAYLLVLIGICCTSALFASYYEPYAPFNHYTPVPFDASLLPDWRTYDQLQTLVSMIPAGSTVLVQQNMPEVYPLQLHHLALAINEEFWSYYQTTPNLSAINALIVDPYSPFFYAVGVYDFGYSPYSALQALWSTGDFGVAAEAEGMLLLERGYCGSPQYFLPLTLTYTSSDFSGSNSSGNAGSVLANASLGGERAWQGAYFFLPPGNYSVTYAFIFESGSNGTLTLDVGGDAFAYTLALQSFEIANTTSEVQQNFTLNFSTSLMNGYAGFKAIARGFDGQILLKSVSVVQLSANPSDLANESNRC
jgi:uncharacterized membrane protein